ncbi:MAG: rod shape-determining protein RodA [Bacteroidia bacterium]|nr:rod shape-determining protein RodA [Bacteroidia bacterium]
MQRSAPDIWLYLLVFLLMTIGILNLYSIEGFPDLSWKHTYTKQLLWAIIGSFIMGLSTLVEGQSWRYFSYSLYAFWLLIMLITVFIAREINGTRAWLEVGALRIQPSEFMKISTILAVSNYLTRYNFRWNSWRDRLWVGLLVGMPVLLTLLQKDTGTALTYIAFLAPFFRWNLSAWIIGIPFSMGLLAFLTLLYPWQYIALGITGIAALSYLFLFRRRHLWWHLGIVALIGGWLSLSDILYQRVLAPHQRQRIQALLNPHQDPLGAGWNVIQARIAVTAGGFTGRGYGKGLQSKLDFIPQRHTDFAFCGIAEEWGWVGSSTLILLYAAFILRITWIAEKSHSSYALLCGYGIAGFIWVHLLINLSMILGLFPVVGIPLVFVSYGGSSWVALGWGIGILQSLYRERTLRLLS